MTPRVPDNAYFSAVVVLACIILGLVLCVLLVYSDLGRGVQELNPRDVPDTSRPVEYDVSAGKPLLTANIRNAAVGVRPDVRESRFGRAADPSVYVSMQESGHPVKGTHGGVVAFTA